MCATSDDYVDLAMRLGNEREYRDAVSASILQRNSVLFDDPAVVDDFEAFFRRAVAEMLQR